MLQKVMVEIGIAKKVPERGKTGNEYGRRNRQNGLCTSWKKNSRLRQDDEVNSMSRLRNRKWKEVKKAAP